MRCFLEEQQLLRKLSNAQYPEKTPIIFDSSFGNDFKQFCLRYKETTMNIRLKNNLEINVGAWKYLYQVKQFIVCTMHVCC